MRYKQSFADALALAHQFQPVKTGRERLGIAAPKSLPGIADGPVLEQLPVAAVELNRLRLQALAIPFQAVVVARGLGVKLYRFRGKVFRESDLIEGKGSHVLTAAAVLHR
jgi:hypothetical protein